MDYKWEATQRDQHGTSVISSRQALNFVGAGATITVGASGRCNGPFVRLSAMQSWSSVVHNRDPDRSGDVYVELNCFGGAPRLQVYEKKIRFSRSSLSTLWK